MSMKDKYGNAIIKLALTKEENDFVLNYIIGNLILTGSRIYGGCNEDSDWDYIIMEKDLPLFFYDKVKYKNFEGGSQPSDNNCFTTSFYLKDLVDETKILNIIVFENKFQYEAWNRTTITLSNLKENKEIFRLISNSKTFRIKLFELIYHQYLIEKKDK